MPWEIAKSGNQFAVVKKGTGEVVAKHKTRKQALNHIQALYANVKDA